MLIFWRVMVISCYIYSFHGNHGKFIIPTDSDFSHLARRQDVPQRESHDFHGTVYASRHWWWLLSWFYNPYIYIYIYIHVYLSPGWWTYHIFRKTPCLDISWHTYFPWPGTAKPGASGYPGSGMREGWFCLFSAAEWGEDHWKIW